MISPFEGMVLGSGTRIQSGVPIREMNLTRKANGLLLPGVVTATYVSDSAGHPQETQQGKTDQPTAVYCDVLVYPSMGGNRWVGLGHVLVSQERGGLYRGGIWKPRATTIDLSKNPVDQISNPAYLDGDHVLVGFMNDSLDQPVILKGLPHPSVDNGHPDSPELGHRMKLKVLDGDPDFRRHHGVYWGVSDIGSFLVDTTRANDGELDELGLEANPPTDGKGGINYRMPQDATFDMVFYDMTDPENPVEMARVTFQKDKHLIDIKDAAGKFHVKIEDGEGIAVTGKDTAAKIVIGDGAVKAAVADYMEIQHKQHTHMDGMGGTLPPSEPWDPKINSDKVTMPDTEVV